MQITKVHLKPGAQEESGVEFDIAVSLKSDATVKGGVKFKLAVVDANLSGRGGIAK